MPAMYRPMPELPPVTMTTLLVSPAMIFLLKMLIWFEYTALQDACLYWYPDCGEVQGKIKI